MRVDWKICPKIILVRMNSRAIPSAGELKYTAEMTDRGSENRYAIQGRLRFICNLLFLGEYTMGKIDLKELLENYTDTLCDKTFKYTIRNKTKNTDEIIKIRFYRENLCHLLGLQHVYTASPKTHLGAAGYKMIDEKKLTVKSLKKHNEKAYGFIKFKLSHFNEIYDILTNGELIVYDEVKTFPKSSIKADFLLYRDSVTYILHLFLIQEYDNYYVPKSFVVQSRNDKYPDKYIKNQIHKSIIDFQEIPNY